MLHVPEKYRATAQVMRKLGATSAMIMATTESDGNNGMFFITPTDLPASLIKEMKSQGVSPRILTIICSDGMGWDHVSVSTPDRCPLWIEMSYVKSLFWDPTDAVVQYHPVESEYVNNHPYCLHMWKNQSQEFVTPPKSLVGV
ncbi:hypothetical protein YerA41_046 [Yersinia phage YerA41]|nr:hypothetical protein YerA41_046 [Yersinia phage YerA41]